VLAEPAPTVAADADSVEVVQRVGGGLMARGERVSRSPAGWVQKEKLIWPVMVRGVT
jgi:hypothetical protein